MTKCNIDNLTLGEIKEIAKLAGSLVGGATVSSGSLNTMVGQKVIVRTYASGVHYGELIEKEGKEVILKNARRLWYWKTTNKGISLSEVALTGLAKDSKVCAAVDLFWTEAVELIPCTKEAIKNIEAQDDYKA